MLPTGMGWLSPASGDISRSMEVQKGEWYYGMNCSECNARIALFHDKSKGKVKVDFVGGKDAKMQTDCPKCGHTNRYVPEDLTSLEAQ